MDEENLQLLSRALAEYDSFSLVWRDELVFSELAKKFEEELSPFLISKIKTDRWPGTQIEDKKAILRTYSVTQESILVLEKLESVFDYIAPNYPEDIAFYKNGDVMYESMAHEKQAWYV